MSVQWMQSNHTRFARNTNTNIANVVNSKSRLSTYVVALIHTLLKYSTKAHWLLCYYYFDSFFCLFAICGSVFVCLFFFCLFLYLLLYLPIVNSTARLSFGSRCGPRCWKQKQDISHALFVIDKNNIFIHCMPLFICLACPSARVADHAVEKKTTVWLPHSGANSHILYPNGCECLCLYWSHWLRLKQYGSERFVVFAVNTLIVWSFDRFIVSSFDRLIVWSFDRLIRWWLYSRHWLGFLFEGKQSGYENRTHSDSKWYGMDASKNRLWSQPMQVDRFDAGTGCVVLSHPRKQWWRDMAGHSDNESGEWLLL